MSLAPPNRGARGRAIGNGGRLARAVTSSLCLLVVLGTAASAEAPFVVVLGVGQDGGYPQAGSPLDHPAWGDRGRRRVPTCLGLVDPDSGERWLFEATPALPEQLHRLDEVAPRPEIPGLTGILVTHAHVGHYTGLMHLGREVIGADAVPVWAMPRMLRFLSENGPWSQLVELRNIELRPLRDGATVELNGRLRVTPILVPHRDEYSETVGFVVEGPRRSFFFLPDIDKWEAWDESAGAGAVERVLARVDLAFLDGSFFADGEVPGRAMSEIPHPFMEESFERFGRLPPEERGKIRFIHLNRTNPAIVDGSAEQAAVNEAGFALAREGERHGL